MTTNKTYNDPLAAFCRKRAAERAAKPGEALSQWEIDLRERYRRGAARNGYGW